MRSPACPRLSLDLRALWLAAVALLVSSCQSTTAATETPNPVDGGEPIVEEPRYRSPQAPSSLKSMLASRSGVPSGAAITPLGYAPGSLESIPRDSVLARGPRAPRNSLRRQVAETVVSTFVVEDEDSLTAVARQLQLQTGVTIVVHPSAEGEAFDAGVVFDFRFANPISLENLLDLVADLAGDEVVWRIRHGVVLFTSRARAQDEYVLAMHDIRRLVAPRRDWIAPRLDRLQLLGDADDGEQFGAIGEREADFDEDQVVTLVTENIERESWDLEGTSIEVSNGLLFVRHTPAVQRRVRAFLAVLGN